jgi:sec-independent protein translocase protein TatA
MELMQPSHLIFVLVIALIVLGPKRLPEVGRSLGRGMRDFRDALSGNDQDRQAPAVSGPEPEPPEKPPPSDPAEHTG